MTMNHSVLTLASIVSVGCALVSGCGPSAPPDVPSTDSTAEGPTPAPPGDSGGPEGATPAPSGEGPAPAPKAGGATVQPVPIGKSEMLAKVNKLGIDVTKTPDLSKIPLGKKKKLMPLFQKSLGMKACTGCHVEGDFKAETKNIKIARGMWNNYVAKLRMNDGSALFCDSCHDGNEHMIPRGDDDAVQKFMTEQYEGELTRADGEEHSCSTCHTDVFEAKIFKDVWGIGG
jgi:hypothetical protein